jgi:hypothetical protein
MIGVIFAALCLSMAGPVIEATPLLTPDRTLVIFDLEKCLEDLPGDTVLKYDVVKLVASLQGVVNRQGPHLIVRFLPGEDAAGLRINVDDYWLTKMRSGWLQSRPVVSMEDLDELLDRYREAIEGVVVWDPAVPATANVAATICGVHGWLPVRAASALYQRVVQEGPRLPVQLSLVGRFDGSVSGSAKCDAYLWAQEQYLDAGHCHPALLANFIDAYTQRPSEPGFQYPDLYNATLANHDYYIAHKAFFFDLGPWADESPVDDPGQPPGTDRKTLESLLHSMAALNGGKRMTTVGGFVPWNLKYTNHGAAGGGRDPVPTEWEYAAVLSAHNAILDADALGLACLANASAYMHYPLAPRYSQGPLPAVGGLEPKTYVLIYMGDYDSAAWLSSRIPPIWDDPERGEVPLAWAFNPNLADRVPYVFDYVYGTKTRNDWFVAGDSGAGYLNPNLLTGDRLGSGLEDALGLWEEHNLPYYRRFDYGITGFVINGFHGDMPLRVQRSYAQFSPRGVGMQLGFAEPIVEGTPFLRHAGDIYPKPRALEQTAAEMARHVADHKPQFLIFRLILQKPSTVARLRTILERDHSDHNWEFCDPYTFFDLYKQAVEQGLLR